MHLDRYERRLDAGKTREDDSERHDGASGGSAVGEPQRRSMQPSAHRRACALSRLVDAATDGSGIIVSYAEAHAIAAMVKTIQATSCGMIAS